MCMSVWCPGWCPGVLALRDYDEDYNDDDYHDGDDNDNDDHDETPHQTTTTTQTTANAKQQLQNLLRVKKTL